MKGGGQIAVSVLLGYLLGRSHKARTAAMLAMMVAAGRSSGEITEMLRRSGLSGSLDKVLGDLRGQITKTGKEIAGKAAGAGTGSLSDLADSVLGGLGGSADRDTGEKDAQERGDTDEDRKAAKPEQRTAERTPPDHGESYPEDEADYDDEYEDYTEAEEYEEEEEPERRERPARASAPNREHGRRVGIPDRTPAAR